MNQKNRVCCIIVNWNTPDLTEACLNSLARQATPPETVVVCDNGSTDDSSRQILYWSSQIFDKAHEIQFLTAQVVDQKQFPVSKPLPKFVFIQNQTNQGFARGNNLGIQWALAQKAYAYIWLLNPDTWVEKTAMQHLIDCAQSGLAVGIWGSSVCIAQKPDTLQCAAGYTYVPWSSVIRPVLGGSNLSAALSTSTAPSLDYIIGASMFLKTEVLEAVGFLCEDYFLFYEELDICKRASKAGYEPGWCRKSITYHHGGTGFNAQSGATQSRLEKIAYHEMLSTLIFTRRFYPHLLPFILLIRLAAKFYYAIRRRQLFLIRPLLRAYLDFGTGKWRRACKS